MLICVPGIFHWEGQVKRNRTEYVIYNYGSINGDVSVKSKFQMKKLMKKMTKACAMKARLTHHRDGSCDFWNIDHSYPYWTVGLE